MLMRLWILFAMVVSAFAGYQSYLRAPATVEGLVPALFGEGAAVTAPQLPLVIAVLVGALVLFALTFLVIGLLDWRKTRHVAGEVARLLERRRDGEEPDRRDFLAAFGEADSLVETAADYAVTLDEAEQDDAAGGRGSRYRATVPADAYFRVDSLVEARLFDPFFRWLPTALATVGLLGLVFGLIDGLRATGAAAAGASFASGAEGGLIALFAGLAAALVVGLARAILIALRRQQIVSLARMVDALFLYGAESPLSFARGVAEEAASIRRAIGTVGGDLRNAMAQQNSQLTRALETQARVAAASISDAVRTTLNTPLVALTAAVEQATRDEGERVQVLIAAALKRFSEELEGQFGNQLAEVNALLRSSSAMAADVERSFAGIADTLSDRLAAQADVFAREMRAALDAETERHAKENKALATQLKRFSTGLAREVDKHSKQFETLLTNALDRVETITKSAVAASSEDLAKTAAAFQGLQTVVESLALSVAPLLNQVLDTQERLLAAIEDESHAGKAIAGAASDMNAAARASRETVEKFVMLASALGGGTVAAPEARDGGKPADGDDRKAAGKKPAKPRAGDALSRALSELRDETEGLIKDLPDL